MRYKLFGRSGLRVSELALGTMTFGEDWGWGAPKEEARKLFDAYAEAGGNFIDTANNYTGGTSERLVGEFIASDRQHFVVATKYTLSTRSGDPNFSGNHRKNMLQALEASLRRLNTDYVDIYWLHAWDFLTPLDEILRAFDDLVRQGKVLYIGISDTPAWIVSMANMLADLRGWTRFTGLQIRYSLVDRAAERDLLPMAQALGLAVTPWGILGSGVLTGKYNAGREGVQGRAANWQIAEQALNIAREVGAIAEAIGASPSQVAIAWLRQQRGLIIPLLGARKLEQLKDNLGALKVQLEPTHLARLEAVSRIDLGFPHDFLASGEIRNIVYGGTRDQIDWQQP
ncbi:MAG: aldo/keto reductase [Candidatus Thermofonsia Clade 1 bacterium]|uniref:Aldo/keto reductase n=1 Tax=Candidatus Thermofonsia Clade 1 bacterium TaxID=2364210 RepID=A0A2M8PGU6_9CHLR|nr:MAG: aldo/keto reductase [Candidatus Thermofonsia Clade 1 bacterium]